ncbi:MAG: flippase-like domain-containing protein [Chitinophagaceae bacterium]|nr:flippase-like domain-containing protein [Chitinophagaceae bacterium]
MARGIDDKGWEQIRTSLKQANYWLFIPVLLMMLLSHYIRALRWKILMEPLGYKPSTFNVFNAVMIGYLANLAFPRLGEVLKCTILARYEKMGPDKLIGTIVAERAIDLVCLIGAFVITILLQIDTVGAYAMTLLQNIFMGDDQKFSWLKLILVLGGVSVFLWLFYMLLKKFSHFPLIEKIKKCCKGNLERNQQRSSYQKSLEVYFSNCTHLAIIFNEQPYWFLCHDRSFTSRHTGSLFYFIIRQFGNDCHTGWFRCLPIHCSGNTDALRTNTIGRFYIWMDSMDCTNSCDFSWRTCLLNTFTHR